MDRSPLNPEEWLKAHGDYLYSFVIRRVSCPQVAEDLISETYLGAFKSKDRFEGKSTERTWLVGILKHKIADYYRKKEREKRYTNLGIVESTHTEYLSGGSWKLGAEPKDWPSLPGANIENREFREAVEACLDELPARHAAIFRLREIEDVDPSKICEEFNITLNNLWVIMHRARALLRTALEKTYFSEGRNQ